MPPKKRGQNIHGRDKIFRNAVEHVHIGVGHHILGNLSLQLAAGSPHRLKKQQAVTAEGTSSTTAAALALLQDRPAFYLELNAQLLSHSSKDFKSFRWEVLELCETRPLFHLHEKKIAQALLTRLMERSGGSYGHKTKSVAATVHGDTDRGSTGEGYEAFTRLTIAFARDMKERFLPYYEVFQRAVDAGLYDRNGQFMADVNRLQLVYAVQAAWCREMAPHWGDPSHLKLVRRIVRIYVQQVHDTREYIRRLGAEWLAFLCRLCRPLISLVIEEACGMILTAYETTAHTAGEEDDEAEGSALGEPEAADVASHEEAEEKETSGASAQPLWSAASVTTFIDTGLSGHPVTDALGFFCAEMIRGMRGAVNSSFESFYVRMLEAFLLLQSVERSGSATQEAFCACLDDHPAAGGEDDDRDGRAAPNLSVHTDKWVHVYGPEDASDMELDSAEVGKSCNTPAAISQAKRIVREVGCAALSAAFASVLRETRKHSSLSNAPAVVGAEETESDVPEVDESAVEDGTDAGFRPTHRLLRAVVACLQPGHAEHVRILAALLTASEYFLWKDPNEGEILREVASKLRSNLRKHERGDAETVVLPCVGAVLELLYPICVSSYVIPETAGVLAAPTSWLLHLQKVFLPVGKAAVAVAVQVGYSSQPSLPSSATVSEMGQVLLLAFSQDILQKNFACCLAEERRLGEEVGDGESSEAETDGEAEFFEEGYEEEGVGSIRRDAKVPLALKKRARHAAPSKVVPSYLTPLALTLLHTICDASWARANEHLGGALTTKKMGTAFLATAAAEIERALLLARLVNDRTRHLSSSPLQQLLRLKSVKDDGKGTPINAGAELAKVLETLVLSVAQLADATTWSQATRRRQRMEWLTVALPLVNTLINTPCASALNAALLGVLRSIRSPVESTTSTAGGQHLATGYSLYAQISAQLVHATTEQLNKHGRLARLQQKKAKKAGAAAAPADPAAPRDLLTLQSESRRHLCTTITLLANGFRLLAPAPEQPSSSPEFPDDSILYNSSVSSGIDRQQLLYGTEQLLNSLLSSIGMQGSVEESSSTNTTASLKSLRLLRQEIPSDIQQQLVEVILLEAMTSSVQPLRVLSLRLLQLLCHPSTKSQDRFAGAAGIETTFFDALLGAELFNPLSRTGNLDGIRQTLTPLVFAVEAGTMVNPLERVILARAMIGLLFIKFAEAWPIATRILAGLIHRERTLMADQLVGAAEEEADAHDPQTLPKKRLEPVVWDSVVSRYAPVLLFGDVVNQSSANEERKEVDGTVNVTEVGADRDGGEAAAAAPQCCYRIAFADHQRYEKGELVSKAFSSSQYMATSVTLVNLTTEDHEVVTWAAHGACLISPLEHGALARHASTDCATVARVFLGCLEEMMAHSSALDRKLRLVESVVLELVAIHRNEHPSGVLQVKRLDERVALAMHACSVAPSPVLSSNVRKRISPQLQSHLDKRVALLTHVYLSYVTDANGRLQRAALDNLSRLKVEPFCSYHAQLTPYCDSMKACFSFLSTFHVDTNIPAVDRAEYISAALTVALPKLTNRVAKDHQKDQAVLRRRLMGFVLQLSEAQESAVVDVLHSLVQRLVFRGAAPNADSSPSTKRPHLRQEDFRFSAMWASWVSQGFKSHAVRRLEQLLRQLLNTISILDALLHAVGQRFVEYVPSCLHLALESYLVTCKNLLKNPLDDFVVTAGGEEGRRLATKFSESVQRSLGNRTVTSLMAQVRRGALTITSLLFEQFPDVVMGTVALNTPGNALFTSYMQVLFANSKGSTHDGIGGSGLMAASQKSHVTPVLRLLTAWVQSPALLPLFSAFPAEVVGTFAEVFAVNHGGSSVRISGRRASIHMASPQAIHEGLRCLTDILSMSEATVVTVAESSPTQSRKYASTKVQPTTVVTTFGDTFVKPYIFPIFTSLYKLIVRGAGASEEKGAAGDCAKDRSHSKRSASVVMSFRVGMWKEIVQVISLLSTHVSAAAQCGTTGIDTSGGESVEGMMAKLLEIALNVVTHPLCVSDGAMAMLATSVVGKLVQSLPSQLDNLRHLRPLVHLMNVVTHPHARLSLCQTVQFAVTHKVAVSFPESRYGVTDSAEVQEAFRAQLAAVGRAVYCLNSFEEDNTSLGRYDYELRYHAFDALTHFFVSGGNTGALVSRKQKGEPRGERAEENAIRQERDYSGKLDVTIALTRSCAPVLCVEAFSVLVASSVFFLRDPEVTIRAKAAQLLQAMMRYSTLPLANPSAKAPPGEDQPYAQLILNEVVRRELLPSLRRGVVAKDVDIRVAHMTAFSSLARHYPVTFPSFAGLYSPNSEENYFLNVGSVQPRSRLHALALLRREAPRMHVRDLLRVFIPFLMSAVKDFAQGKRAGQNMTEGRARGYCDAVLLTIAAIAEKLPWDAYYRVLSLFLANASANAALRSPMLRGVVQVLNYFHFLNGEEEESAVQPDSEDDDDDDDDGGAEDDDADVTAAVTAKRRQYRQAKIMHVLEQDILPQLFAYIGDGRQGKKALGDVKGSNAHSVSAIRKEQEREDSASTKNAILQLPVAVAITKIVRRFPDDRFNHYVDHLLNELILKLRTKNDKHRDSARRILGAMLQETGPTKLRFIITKLKDNLVHGYQLHVLGYTVVTLLYQLYEPHHAMLQETRRPRKTETASSRDTVYRDPVKEALEAASQRQRRRLEDADHTEEEAEADGAKKPLDTADEDVADAEEDLLKELMPYRPAFDYQLGVTCITNIMDELMLIFLDDYLGEVGMQKTQVELMSKMVEMKRNRSLQGLSFIAKHCEGRKVMEVFLQRITWVLTPPSDTSVDVSELHGSARARVMLVNELRSKYLTVSKNASADLFFVNKVRLLAVRVARSLMTNPTMDVTSAFAQVRDLLDKHNTTREEKIRAFEAKDGTRRIRGNAHLIIHGEERTTLKEQRDKNFLVAPVPERVDVDFSTHTVLATQQKQKLKVYKGRYGKELKEAAKDFYREDPTTAVVLDTVDEFLLKYLLSVLKRVLGIGKERKYSAAAMKLDLLRRRKNREMDDEGNAVVDADEDMLEDDSIDAAAPHHSVEREDDDSAEASEEGDADSDHLEPQALSESEEDDLDAFATAQEDATTVAVVEGGREKKPDHRNASTKSQLSSTFTREYRELLEALLPSVLATLRGEGCDTVVATALDCLLALASLRPPLKSVDTLHAMLFETVTAYFGRGGAIKQRAMRVCAAVIALQPFKLPDDQAAQLVHLVRAEIMDRSEFLPMALSLFYAVLSKHSHIGAVYDLVDIITELMVHLSSKKVVRSRCIRILVRFLTEFRLTKAQFHSHIDLLCKNLDFPELSGRLALLETLDTLTGRLPVVVLREEAPVLLVPLSATLTSCEWRECRQRAGRVLQHLAKNAGIDVLVPLLSGWMADSQPRPTRAMAMQAWATILPALATLYRLDTEDEGSVPADDQAAFVACCQWSVSLVLTGCLYDQQAAAGSTAKPLAELRGKDRERVELKGWTYMFFSLRCAEAMLLALPERFYLQFGEALLRDLMDRLMRHTHPWVRAVALRILRHFCYNYVEPHCRFLQDGHVEAETASGSEPSQLPLVLLPGQRDSRTWYTAAQAVFSDYMALLKRLLTQVGLSDVSDEKYTAHQAMEDPARAECLKLMVYVSKALTHIALDMLHCCPKQARSFLRPAFIPLTHHLHSVAQPAIKQNSVVNYMVRCATLIQFSGGFVSVLPTVSSSESAEHRTHVQWLLQEGMQVPALLQDTVVPLLCLGLNASQLSQRLAHFAHQAATLVEQQVEERRECFRSSVAASVGSKRRREADPEEWNTTPLPTKAKGDAAYTASPDVCCRASTLVVSEVLATLNTILAKGREVRQDKRIAKDTNKVLKRNRREMNRHERQSQQSGRHQGGRRSTN